MGSESINIKQTADKIIENVSKVIVGKNEVIRLILAGILSDGHILIEDNPGTGKTMLARAVAKSIECDFKRVQFTPDLMPSDITGLNVFNPKQSSFELVRGPVFTNILLADEINRATPRTQSGLLEAMEEKQVTIDGKTIKLDNPFVVIATENPLETTGTYPLPEASLDRFIMKLSMGSTEKEEEISIIDRYIEENPFEKIEAVCTIDELLEMKKAVKKIFVHACVREYIVDIIMAARGSDRLSGGVSTRGTLSLVRCAQAYSAIIGKPYVDPDVVKTVAPHVLSHRAVSLGGYNASSKNNDIIRKLINDIDVPVENWEI
ncbi:MAG: MoxR family ATPase [Lachnospiraceae bacterium]|nr:MoxR family ATPase [Lachnospiraceae bacterium]